MTAGPVATDSPPDAGPPEPRLRRPGALLPLVMGVVAGAVVLNGALLLTTSWWTSYGNWYEVFGLTGIDAGLATLVLGLVYLGLAFAIARGRAWAWALALVFTVAWVADAGYSLTSGSPHWLGLFASILLLFYLIYFRRPDPLIGFFRVLSANTLSFAGFVMVIFLATLAVVLWLDPSVLPYAPFYPDQFRTGAYGLAPTIFHWPPSLAYPFGTDELSRNMFSMVLAALPTDLGVSVFIATAALLIGGTLGIIAGFWDEPRTAGGWASVVILRVTDIFLAFPSLVLALVIVAIFGHGALQCTLAILVAWWPAYVRLARGEVLAVKGLPYVTAAKSAGVSNGRIILRHILRNIAEPMIVYFTLDIGTVIVTLATISYVGVGFPANIPEWGNMFAQYTESFIAYPWTMLSVGFMIFVTVLAFSLLGDGLRDVLDPRSRRMLAQASVVSQTAAQEEPELAPSLPAGGGERVPIAAEPLS